MSKGSVRRPTNESAYRDNYDRIFNKTRKDTKTPPTTGKSSKSSK